MVMSRCAGPLRLRVLSRGARLSCLRPRSQHKGSYDQNQCEKLLHHVPPIRHQIGFVCRGRELYHSGIGHMNPYS